MSLRLGVFATHPIQYQAPLWRGLAGTPGLDVLVSFLSDHSLRGGVDPGFGVAVSWDVPVLEGYGHRFLSRDADLSRPGRVALPGDARAEVASGRFDWVLIHGYAHRFERQVVAAARRGGARSVLRATLSDVTASRASVARRLARGLYLRWFYRRVDRHCYVGEGARRHLVAHGVPRSRLFSSPYAVDTLRFEEQVRRFDRAACRAELGIAADQLVLLFCGKVISVKDPLTLAVALARLPDPSKVTLLVVGEGELRAALRARAGPLLGRRLVEAGFVNQSQLGRYYAAADVLVLPSSSETWGAVVNEAMQFALPAIVSDGVTCHHDLVVPGTTGFVFPVGSPGALADRIRTLLELPGRAAAMGRAARERVLARHSTSASLRGVLEALGVPRAERPA